MASDADALPTSSNTRTTHADARTSHANAGTSHANARTPHANVATSCTDTRTFGGRMWSGQFSGPRGNRDAGWSRMVRSSTAEFLIVTRPPRAHSQRIGYVQSELRIVGYGNLELLGFCKG